MVSKEVSSHVPVSGGERLTRESVAARLAAMRLRFAQLSDSDEDEGERDALLDRDLVQMRENSDAAGSIGDGSVAGRRANVAARLAALRKRMAQLSESEDDDGANDGQGSGGVGRARRERGDFRRGLLVRERDQLAAQDIAEVKLRERLGRQAYLAQRAQHAAVVDQQRSAQALKEAKSSAKVAVKARATLWEKVYGAESLFYQQGLPADGPAPPSEMPLPGWVDPTTVAVPVLPLRGLASAGEPLRYVPALCQLLLRLPRFLAWLASHGKRCAAGGGCVACALFRSHQQLGTGVVPELWRCRGALAEVVILEPDIPVEPLDFFASLVEATRRVETEARRSLAWPGFSEGADVEVTAVDRLFAFVEVVRRKCASCGCAGVAFERKTSLRLQAPLDVSRSSSVYDAFLEYCAPRSHLRASCCRCGGEREHTEQREVQSLPEILLVGLARSSDAGSLARYRFCVDEQVSLPKLPGLTLAGVLFHRGRSRSVGHYTCAARGPEGRFWFFDDAREPVTVPNMAGFFDKNVDALIYTTAPSSGGEARRTAQRPGGDTEAAELELARQRLEALRGLGVALAPKPGDAVREVGAAERASAVLKYRMDAGKTWRGRTFVSWIFDDEEEAKQLLEDLRPEEDPNQRGLQAFADGCRVFGLRKEDFDEREVHVRPRGLSTAERSARIEVFKLAQKARANREGMARLFAPTATGSASSRQESDKVSRPQRSAPVHSLQPGARAGSAASSSVPGSSSFVPQADAPQAQHVLLGTRLGNRLQELSLGGTVLEALLAQLQQIFGDGAAYALADDTEWVVTWNRWESFAVEVLEHGAELGDALLTEMRDLLFAFSRIAADNVEQPERTNEEALHDLFARGFERRRGHVWGENQCLADSLLQLLIFHGLVDENVDRKHLCAENRRELEDDPITVPRNRWGQWDFGGYLQHDRHAEPTLRFFLGQAASSLRRVPAAGFRLIVHARSDHEVGVPDVEAVCVGVGEKEGPPLCLHLFCHTADDHEGYHYDLLVPVEGAAAVVDLAGDGAADDTLVASGAAAPEPSSLPILPPVIEESSDVCAPDAVTSCSPAAEQPLLGASPASGGDVEMRHSALEPETREEGCDGGPGVAPSSVESAELLFDCSPLQDGRCQARIWQSDKSKAVFQQCRQPPKQGRFCTTHAKKLQDPAFLGIWDPPEHASVPSHKLEEARKEAKRRVTRALEEVSVAPQQVRARGRGRGGRAVGARGSDGGLETTPRKGSVEMEFPAPGQERARVQRAGFGVVGPEASTSAAPSVGADDASRAEVRDAAGAADTVQRVEARRGVPTRRGHGAAAADTQRKRFGDLGETRAENEYVDEEMRSRGAVQQGGQWVGGQVRPGEPADVNLQEEYLREQFRRQRAEEKAKASRSWGHGHRLDE